jgi:hypothetical protein
LQLQEFLELLENLQLIVLEPKLIRHNKKTYFKKSRFFVVIKETTGYISSFDCYKFKKEALIRLIFKSLTQSKASLFF